MAKKNKKPFKQEVLPFEQFPFKNKFVPYIILGVIAVALYFNTIWNEFALDDGIIIHKNEYVMEGISGIDSIMSRDAYHSFYKQMNAKDQLAGGRYRPLSVVTFAIEQEFIGPYEGGHLPPNCWDEDKNGKFEPHEDINKDGLFNENDCLTKGCMLRHFNNMLLFAISVLILYHLLINYMFPAKPDVAFLSALLFCIHPIHTEAVANMKSRDEIMSMLFIGLTFIQVFKFAETYKTKHIIWASIHYFLSLLSKEYAVTLIAVIPLTIYIFRQEVEWKKFYPLFIGLGIALFIYLKIRFSIVVAKPAVPDTEILNNPYLLATKLEKLATKIYVWLKYLILLFVPHPLSADYSYNSIPYRNFGSWDTLLSLVIYIGLVIASIKLFFKKHPLAFALLFYFANFLMICNLLFDIGATMGERLIYHSSFGWAIAMGWLISEGARKYLPEIKKQKLAIIGFSLIITVLFGYKTITRNVDWKSDITLFTHDVNTMPESVLCLGNAGARWIDLSERPANKAKEKEYLNKAIGYLTHALELHPKYVNGYLNLGLAHFKLGNLEKAEETWANAWRLYPNNPYLLTYYRVLAQTYMTNGFNASKDKKIEEGMKWFERATRVAPNDYEVWYNYGGAAFTLGDYKTARMAFERCLQINPNYELAKNGLANCPQ